MKAIWSRNSTEEQKSSQVDGRWGFLVVVFNEKLKPRTLGNKVKLNLAQLCTF